jgi:hypothetical protein
MNRRPDKTLYRVHERQIPRESLGSALFAEVEADAPQYRLMPVGQWYCGQGDCAVNEVRVTLEYYDNDPPPDELPAMRCPACGGPMEFRHYRREIILLPITLVCPPPRAS